MAKVTEGARRANDIAPSHGELLYSETAWLS